MNKNKNTKTLDECQELDVEYLKTSFRRTLIIFHQHRYYEQVRLGNVVVLN